MEIINQISPKAPRLAPGHVRLEFGLDAVEALVMLGTIEGELSGRNGDRTRFKQAIARVFEFGRQQAGALDEAAYADEERSLEIHADIPENRLPQVAHHLERRAKRASELSRVDSDNPVREYDQFNPSEVHRVGPQLVTGLLNIVHNHPRKRHRKNSVAKAQAARYT